MIYISLFIASFLAATVVPVASEVALSGALSAGENMFICIAVATAGNTMGSCTTYMIGRAGKIVWIEKYLKISQAKVLKMQEKILKYGAFSAFFCFLPLFGDIIAVALGFMRYPFKKFLIPMALGKLIRYTLWSVLFLKTVDLLK